MEALDRIDISQNWITLIFVFVMILLFVLKSINQNRLAGYSKAFFLKGFIEKKAEEKLSYFSFFNITLFIFSILVLSLAMLLVFDSIVEKETLNITTYIQTVSVLTIYFVLFLFIDELLSAVFNIKEETRLLIAAKTGYLYNSTLLLLPALIIEVYGFRSSLFIKAVFLLLLTLSIVLIAVNNKKLIVNKLFYFILYICALEIAPLLIFYKITI